MGSMASRSRRTEVVSPDAVRVVHLNGHLEEFSTPVSVKRALRNDPEEDLRLGELYFLLPLSALESDLSPENLVALAARLYAAARKEVSKRAAKQRSSVDSTCDLPGECRSLMYEKLLRSCDDQEVKMALKEHLMSKSRLWTPRLHTCGKLLISAKSCMVFLLLAGVSSVCPLHQRKRLRRNEVELMKDSLCTG